MEGEEGGEKAEHKRVEGFLALLFIGFFVVLVGVVLLAVSAVFSEGQISFGGFVFIGPFPIVFGAGPEAPWLVLFAVILGVLSVIMLFVLWKIRVKRF